MVKNQNKLANRKIYTASYQSMNLKDECLVCMDKPLSVALVPCGHVCYCLECAEREKIKECPNCRSKVDEMQRIYR